ncbi:MAG: PHP domain-containing protein [Anaerolineales bacterium]|nr:PHP domain-containing protein [Anaerolineales bacterium]MDW8226998.1 PHP domain-containing protein [Anaerolineales bacterium]
MGRADLHIHSLYSYDATTTVRAILRQAQRVGLDVIAITDHDDMRAVAEAQRFAPQYGVEVIPAAEVSTRDGHLLALFIHSLPPAGLSLKDTLLQIGRQGGIAILPHPFNNLPASLRAEAVFEAMADPRVKGVIKGIETDNMGTQALNETVRKLSVYLPLAKIAASDAHVYWAVGAASTQFPGRTAQDLRQALEWNLTTPIPYQGKFLPKGILSWLRYIFLRRLGYAVDVRAGHQIDTQPLPRDYLRHLRSSLSSQPYSKKEH